MRLPDGLNVSPRRVRDDIGDDITNAMDYLVEAVFEMLPLEVRLFTPRPPEPNNSSPLSFLYFGLAL